MIALPIVDFYKSIINENLTFQKKPSKVSAIREEIPFEIEQMPATMEYDNWMGLGKPHAKQTKHRHVNSILNKQVGTFED